LYYSLTDCIVLIYPAVQLQVCFNKLSYFFTYLLTKCARTDEHVAVGGVGDGKEMRRHLRAPLALVLGDHGRSVDRQATVRVDDDAEQTPVRLPNTEQTRNYAQHRY